MHSIKISVFYKKYNDILVAIGVSFITGLLFMKNYLLSIGLISLLIFIFLVLKYDKEIFIIWLISFPILNHIANVSLGPYPDITFNRVIIGTSAMIIIIKRVFEKKGDISGKIVIAAFFFLAAALYSSIRSFSPIRAIQEVIDGYAMPFLVFYIGVYLFRRKMEIGKLSWLFIVLGLYVSLLGIIEFISSYDFFPSPVGLRMTSYYLRSNGPFYTSEAYAMFLSLCFFIWRYIKQNKKEPWSKIEKTGLIIIFIGILCSMLRTILIAFMAAYFFPFIYDRKKLIRHLFYFAGIAVLIVALFPFIAKSPIYQQRIADYQNVATRFSAYYTSIAIIKDHVIQGIGLLNFSEFSKMNKYSISFRGYSHPSSAHNVILSILAEMGLLGFIPFCAIIYWIISSFIIVSRFNLSKNMGLISVLIVYLLPSLSLNLSMSAPNNYLFFFFLSSLYVQRINNLDYNKDT